MNAAQETPVAKALRALQMFDEKTHIDNTRYLLMEAMSHLGEELGLECTGVVDGWNDDDSPAFYKHNGSTCPIHEWLVESDSQEGGPC